MSWVRYQLKVRFWNIGGKTGFAQWPISALIRIVWLPSTFDGTEQLLIGRKKQSGVLEMQVPYS